MAKVVKFDKPYKFEGAEYMEVDLTGMDGLTVKDAAEAQNMAIAMGNTAAAVVTETSTAFTNEIAARAAKMPVEFFQYMPLREARKVRLMVQNHMNGDQAENGALKLNAPYEWKGETYEKLDFSGVAELNAMNATEAENKMARMGVIAPEPALNYNYCCIIASMATKLPEGFFTGLPLCEATKLKNAVNSADFFG